MNKIKNEEMLENKLLELIAEEHEVYINECDLDKDRWIDIDDFADSARQIIEYHHGYLKFLDFNIEDYAREYAESNKEALAERASDLAEAYGEE